MHKQNSCLRNSRVASVCALALVLLTFAGAARTVAQATNDYQEERKRAMLLYDQNKFTEAIPLLEKLARANSADMVVWERLGWATFVVSGSIKDVQERKKARQRAREALLHAKELGDNSELLRTGLEGLEGPDAAEVAFSSNKEADAAMREGEEAHTKGELDKAIAAYERALRLDPKLYFAALFAGDMYFKKGYQATDPRVKRAQMDKAGEWFARAIAIDENVETAYRYWGDALMNIGMQEQAMTKFIEAIIAEPGNRNGYMGLSQWGERNQTGMAHPEIEIPIKLSLSGENKLNFYFDPALRESADGSGAWEHYGLVRAKWVGEDFAKNFPGEKAYRHTLREEAEALSKVAETASALLKSGKVKSLSPALSALVKLNEAGLLEPFIFFTRADEGIVKDYEAFRRTNRDKLRRYWAEFVISR